MEQFKLIYIFATVLQYGSMNATAPHLGMTASAISQAIRKLENHYGVKLLNRTTRSRRQKGGSCSNTPVN